MFADEESDVSEKIFILAGVAVSVKSFFVFAK
jgi:hypothetical protein